MDFVIDKKREMAKLLQRLLRKYDAKNSLYVRFYDRFGWKF